LDVPLYTATGWGNAAIADGAIPVTSAYPYPTWSKAAASPLYLYKELRAHPDYEPISYDPQKYPSFGAELGGGIMVTYSRRPTISPRSLESLIVRELGSGANAIGYYMFHGGATPRGQQSYLSDEASGVPKISYDFQAPIGQYGQLGDSYRHLKLIHYFLADFGAQLAPMTTVLPQSAAELKPSDVDHLRFAMRSRGDSGFVFLHNFQDHAPTHDLSNLQLAIRTTSEELRIPHSRTLTLKNETSAIMPVNIDFGPIHVKYATAQPLCRLTAANSACYAFVAVDGIEPEFAITTSTARNIEGDCRTTIDGDLSLVRCDGEGVKEFTIDSGAGDRTTFVVLPKSLALRAWLINTSEGKRLLFTDATVLTKAGGIELYSHDNNKILLSAYPALHKPPERAGKPLEEATAPHPSMSAYRLTLPEIEPFVHAKLADRKTLTLKTEKTSLPEGINDVFLEIDYTGDVGMAFIKGQLVDDHFYFGQPWRIGLKRFFPRLAEDEMYISFRPIAKDAPFIPDLPMGAVPDFSKQNEFLRINHVRVAPEYRAEVGL
jgi:beta-galactosidase